MQYFPAFLDLKGRRCLLVGGGAVALRKARLLNSAGAATVAVAPAFSAEFAAFAADSGLQCVARTFRSSDVAGAWLVIAASDDAAVNRAAFDAANTAGVFCNSVDDKDRCSYITPAIVDRGELVVAISSSGSAPVLARSIRAMIEARLPPGIAQLVALAGRWRHRVRQSLLTLNQRRRFWESVFNGSAAAKAVRGDTGGAEAEMAALLEGHSGAGGEAWLVGAGPGDPNLLTLRALQVLQTADVILHDRLVAPAILALARRDADLVSVGKVPGGKSVSQETINEKLVALVAAGKRVCRLKGGDPFVFGRGGEELQALQNAGLSCEVVPGITAAAGCAAAAGIPLTHRDHAQSVVLATAHGKGTEESLDWASLARERQTLVFYMGVKRFGELMRRLTENGRDPATPIAIVENGTTPEQRILRGTLGQLALLAAAHNVRPPSVLIVGDVAALGHAPAQAPAAGGAKWLYNAEAAAVSGVASAQ